MNKTPEYILNAVKRYNHSDKGKTTREAYLKRNHKRISKNYLKKRREEARVLCLSFETKTPEYVLKAVRKYNKTDKGKATKKRWVNKNKDRVNAYQRKFYDKKRKKKMKEAEKNRICTECLKNPVTDTKTCEACRKNNRKWRKQRKKEDRGEYHISEK